MRLYTLLDSTLNCFVDFTILPSQWSCGKFRRKHAQYKEKERNLKLFIFPNSNSSSLEGPRTNSLMTEYRRNTCHLSKREIFPIRFRILDSTILFGKDLSRNNKQVPYPFPIDIVLFSTHFALNRKHKAKATLSASRQPSSNHILK